ncbi:hypothetical protein [Culicoidibacter larvae]|uniref:Squalene cyclase C-terminal domain-containing protein n=1 Tax=Culicoidibacter larvae TaxID=2579976 RepID=A0A5R8Q8J8_9FIRM|nr:hypothetical protein [Culicoidibacter larvae]TLG71525.1 hypothetical protein FEZ08_10545 [Culicoidibacter larvae]
MNQDLLVRLTAEWKPVPLYNIWRLIALSELDDAFELIYAQQVIDYVREHLFCEVGFSFTGKRDDIVPCYNAMILEALCKLGLADSEEVEVAVNWIRQYQFFAHGGMSEWDGRGILKYGGCLQATPCYIGVAKTVKALLVYQRTASKAAPWVAELIENGMAVIKQHQFCFRLTNGKPISKHIMETAFPASYVLSINELAEIAWLSGNSNDESTAKMKQYLLDIRDDAGMWGVMYQYKGDGYISFDGGKRQSPWITDRLNRFLFAEESLG